MFLRFITDEIDNDSQVAEGVFQAAAKLRETGSLSEIEVAQLKDLSDWFDKNLKKPARFNRTKSKGYYRRKTKGISWFKSSASEHLNRIRDFTVILEQHGVHVRMISTDRPGYITYEDDIQVVAEPFSDTIVG